MSTKVSTAIGRLVILLAVVVHPASARSQGPAAGPPPQTAPGLTLTSAAFADGGEIPAKFTQGVPNAVSPALDWTHVPPGTVTFVLSMRDPDVALQRKLEDPLHWMVFNIPGSARALPEGVPSTAQLPDGTIQIKNRRGGVGYMGPGAGRLGPHHHYTFELFAVDVKLELGPDATRADVLKAIDGHIVGKAVLVGRYHL
jgi:Raf kinase inhibitor-like YbhB/YbcL family protein